MTMTICLWDKLPDEIQSKITMLAKDLFWYSYGEKVKNIQRSRSYIMCNLCKHKKDQKPYWILYNVLAELKHCFEEVMFRAYPREAQCPKKIWLVNGRDPISIFYGGIDKKVNLSPSQLVEELIDLQTIYDNCIRGKVNTDYMNYHTFKLEKHHYQKKIDRQFKRINKIICV
jgi:hypothetical protein